MIARTPGPDPSPTAAGSPPDWRRGLASAVRDLGELLGLVGLDPDRLPRAFAADPTFPLRVPRGFVARMRPGDPEDPLLLQVLPTREERDVRPGFVADPVGDGPASPRPGVIHKYGGRALLVVTGACAVHCRYCFRREFPYGPHAAALDEALAWLAERSDVEEVLLSGGDPLSLGDGKLADLVERICSLPHVRRLRVHTRLPIVLPERVTPELTETIRRAGKPVVVVVHSNHAREIDAEVDAALRRLGGVGALLLNQAVLLRGVNDSVDALVGLSERLFEARVLPYYLHLLDPVAGAGHFEVGEDRARALLWEAARRLPGYLVPRLVREIAGEPAKVPVPWGPRAGDPGPRTD